MWWSANLLACRGTTLWNISAIVFIVVDVTVSLWTTYGKSIINGFVEACLKILLFMKALGCSEVWWETDLKLKTFYVIYIESEAYWQPQFKKWYSRLV